MVVVVKNAVNGADKRWDTRWQSMAAVHQRNLNSLAAHLGRFFFLFISIFIGPILWALPGFYRVFTASDLVEPDWTGFLLGSIECYRVFFNDLFITDGCRSFVAVFFCDPFSITIWKLVDLLAALSRYRDWLECVGTDFRWSCPSFTEFYRVLPGFFNGFH